MRYRVEVHGGPKLFTVIVYGRGPTGKRDRERELDVPADLVGVTTEELMKVLEERLSGGQP